MQTEQLSLHRALATLKVLDKRIQKDTQEFLHYNNGPVATRSKIQKIPGFTSDADFIASVESKYNSIFDLIKRRNAIKHAVINANAVTKIKINTGEEMTIAEAIDLKSNIDNQLAVHRGVIENINASQRDVENRNAAILSAISNQFKETRNDDIGSAIQSEYAVKQLEVITSKIVQEKASKERDRLSAFVGDVDAAISEANAITIITVSY